MENPARSPTDAPLERRAPLLLPAVATLAGVFSVAYSLRLIHQVFFGPLSQNLPRTPHEPTRGMLLPSALLVIACLLVGTLPARIASAKNISFDRKPLSSGTPAIAPAATVVTVAVIGIRRRRPLSRRTSF